MEETKAPKANQIILILQKQGITSIIRDWIYNFAPEIYYKRTGVLGVEEYRLYMVHGNKSYYKLVEGEK